MNIMGMPSILTVVYLNFDGQDLQCGHLDLPDFECFEFITEGFGDGVNRLLISGSCRIKIKHVFITRLPGPEKPSSTCG